jgi:hypothetical protein
MAQTYRPGGPEYMALSRVVMALDDAAGIVMSKPGFFHAPWHRTSDTLLDYKQSALRNTMKQERGQDKRPHVTHAVEH